MIKVSVVSKKDLAKIISKFIVTVIILIIIINMVKFSNAKYSKTEIDTGKYISYLSEEITAMSNTNIPNISKINPEQILDSELMFSEYTYYVLGEERDDIEQNELVDGNNQEENEEADGQVLQQGNQNDEIEEQNVQNDIQVEEIEQTLKTEVISSTYKPTYNCEINGVKIKNESKYNLNAVNLNPNNVKIENKNVIIFHTHTCESYTQTEKNMYESSGNYRTTDLNYSVAKVGDVLQRYLTSYGFNVIHDKTYHDYPAYNGSYGRSLKTVSSILAKNPKTDILIDLHRDAMNDESYAPKVKIGDEYVSQIMFVIGTDGSGLDHPNWKKNLEYAIKVQQKANEMYPGLFKPIIVRNARYNQNLANCATIIEFGATGNTLEECEGAAKYLAKVIENII